MPETSAAKPLPMPGRACAGRLVAAFFAALIAVLGVPPAPPGLAAPTEGTWDDSLAGRLLVATEKMGDPRFQKTVIYMIEHNRDGAMGLVINVPMGASSSQLSMALEALAMAAPYVVAPLAEVVNSEKDSLPAGATVLLVTPSLIDSLLDDIAGIRYHGFPVLVLYTGDGLPEQDLGEIRVVPMFSILDPLEVHEPVMAD